MRKLQLILEYLHEAAFLNRKKLFLIKLPKREIIEVRFNRNLTEHSFFSNKTTI